MRSEPDSFWPVHPTPDACWEWDGSLSNGYGQLAYRGKPISAHRYSFFLTHGYWPNICRHSCNNRKCYNPAHLKDGTYKDNMDDRRAAGNYPSGEHNGAAKLNGDQVRIIKSLRGQKTEREIAAMFGVARSTIASIMQGKNWPDA